MHRRPGRRNGDPVTVSRRQVAGLSLDVGPRQDGRACLPAISDLAMPLLLRPASFPCIALVLAVLAACGDDEADGEADAPGDVAVDASTEDTDGGATTPDGGSELPEARIDLGPDLTVAGCASVVVPLSTDVEPSAIDWHIDGPPVRLERDEAGARLHAPVTNRPWSVVVRATAEGFEGEGAVTVTIEPTPDDASLAEGMAWDCEPFTTGVASGDPGPDSVVLWTRAELPLPATLTWDVATDVTFDTIVATGTVDATDDTDGTVSVVVEGLEPGQTYSYRFTAPDGQRSTTGRTRTTPVGDVDHVRLASMSCSSIYSGWFNAYADLARRDLDLVVHVGDYIYDFVDPDEEVRVPDPYPSVPQSRDEWRERHRFYLADPDLRAARAAHPWLAIWDNHDIVRGPEDAELQTREVFREYLPMRRPDADDPGVAWRTVSFGDLADVTIVDIYGPRVGDESLMSEPQWASLTDQMQTGDAVWQVLGNQELVSPLLYPPGTGPDGASDWDDIPGERERFFDLLGARGDTVVLSGDLHFTIASDLVLSPADPAYVPGEGDRSVGVELLAAGITRGNFDETICGGLCDTDVSRGLLDALAIELRNLNPHFAGLDVWQQGYGLVDVTPDAVTASMVYLPIREPSDEPIDGPVLTVEQGANWWSRDAE